ncbi:MAG: phosphatidate cytidylyltransferase [Solirubrobacteraceae bacterium]
MARAQGPPRSRQRPRPAPRDPGRAPARDPDREPSRDRARTRAAGPERDRGRRASRGSDLLARILVAVPAAIVAIVFVDVGGTAWALFMLAIACLCLYELYRLLGRWRPVQAVGFAAVAAMVLAARFGGQRDVLEIAVIALPVAFLLVLARGPQKLASVSIAGTLLGVWWIGIAFSHAVLLRRLDHGSGVMIDIMVGTFLADTAAYIGGRIFGRRPLAPSISPNKTVEGLFCGALIAILSIFVAGLNQIWLTQGDALLLGVMVAVLGPIGDLFESLVKRDAGAKDAGGLLGAHGGVLDRLDAIIFTVVGGYYVWLAVLH